MSNNVTPIRQPPVQAATQDWWWPPQPSQPIWPPQGTCGPSPPSCFSQIAKADACWDQSQALYNLVYKVVADVLQNNPGLVPPPPPGASSNPITGVTDGSNAQPGQVGEFVQLTAQAPYQGSPVFNSGVTSIGVIPPGDWDLAGAMRFSNAIGGAWFVLSPQPPGFSTDMMGSMGTAAETAGPTIEWVNIIGQPARASISVPTLIAFSWVINQGPTGLPGGTVYFTVGARRRR